MADKPPKNSEKSATTTSVAPATLKSTRSWLLAKAFLSLSVIGLSNYASQPALHPLYGEKATGLYFPHMVAGAMVLAMMVPMSAESEGFLWHLLAAVLSLAPYSAYTFGAATARWGNFMWGPIAAQVPLAISTTVIGSWLLRTLMFSLVGISQDVRFYRSLFFVTSFAWVNMTSSFIASKMPRSALASSCNIFFALAVVTLITATANSLLERPPPQQVKGKPYKVQPHSGLGAYRISLAALSIGFLFTTRSTRPCGGANFPLTLSKNGMNVRLLASTTSLTGLVSVAEAEELGFRFMRCDHSLLGGVWLGEERISSLSSTQHKNVPAGGTDKQGERLGDSIYAAFVLQDGIRLFKRPPPKGKQSALIIGLGIGVMARSMTQQGISTTIVEIDPAVHRFAVEFFNLTSPFPTVDAVESKMSYFVSPEIPQTHYMDAREYVHRRASIISGMRPIRETDRYDYVVHDVFSGGTVPTHLFTMEFWEDVKVVMKLDGILAVNFAGKINSDASRAILTTLERTFSTCKVYHDRMQTPNDDGHFTDDDFLNMVYFCSQSPEVDLSLRRPTRSDYGDSRLRYALFESFPKLEVPRARIMGGENVAMSEDSPYVLFDQRNYLGLWQEATAIEHWQIMREVMPAAVWEVY